MEKEIHKCSAEINCTASRDILSRLINGGNFELCGRKAKYFENNDWYCGTHSPSKVKEREDKRYQKWKNSLNK